jgi:hypothetical protein
MTTNEHTDYFGKEIRPGDKVLRAMHSELYVETVVKLTPRAIHFKRKDQWSIDKGLPPLRIAINRWWDTKNLIKLKNDSDEYTNN